MSCYPIHQNVVMCTSNNYITNLKNGLFNQGMSQGQLQDVNIMTYVHATLVQ